MYSVYPLEHALVVFSFPSFLPAADAEMPSRSLSVREQFKRTRTLNSQYSKRTVKNSLCYVEIASRRTYKLEVRNIPRVNVKSSSFKIIF